MAAKARQLAAFTRGFDRGNYGNAYENNDWHSWYAENCTKIPVDWNGPEYLEGLLLGFFSSYAIAEISDNELADEVATLRAKWGDE